MKPRVNNPAWVRAIQDVLDVLDAQPPDQLNADPGTTGFQQFLAGTGSMLSWWGDIGSNAKTSDSSVVGDVVGFEHPAGLGRRLQPQDRPVGHAARRPQLRAQHGLYRLGRLRHGAGRQRSEEAEGGLERCGASRRQGPLAVVRGLSVRASSPTATATSTSAEWVAAGYDEAFIADYLGSEADSYNHPNAAIEPRIPGIFQYYSVAEDELAKIYAGQFDAQTGADNIAAAWEKITDQIGRDQQIALYKASLGI